jgi:hypothetical protein
MAINRAGGAADEMRHPPLRCGDTRLNARIGSWQAGDNASDSAKFANGGTDALVKLPGLVRADPRSPWMPPTLRPCLPASRGRPGAWQAVEGIPDRRERRRDAASELPDANRDPGRSACASGVAREGRYLLCRNPLPLPWPSRAGAAFAARGTHGRGTGPTAVDRADARHPGTRGARRRRRLGR